MSLTVSIDGVLRLEDIYAQAGYRSLKSARNAVARGSFPIARIEGDPRVRFTAENVAAYTQRGQVTNARLLDRIGPKSRRFFGKARARVVNR